MSSLINKSSSQINNRNSHWIDNLSLIIFLVFIFLAIRYQIRLLNYIEWGDESETIVVAKMIAAGERLYSQIFNHHGPLIFIPGILLEKYGSFGISGHRIFIALLQISSLVSLYCSPLIQGVFAKRLYVMVAASVMLLYFPDMFGHMYTYQVVAGLLIVIILAQYTLPAILSPEHLTGKRIIFCNLLISALPFLAITYAPVSLLLFVVSARKDHIAKSILMLIAGGIANIIILKLIGSIRGFLAFHIYLNTITMRDYGGGQTVRQLIEGVFTNSAMDLNHFIIMLLLLASTAQMAMSEKRFPWRSVLLMLGISSLLMRGFGFHGLPYYYSMLAIPLALLSNRASESITLKAFGFVVVTICIIKLSLIIPGSGSKFEARKVPNETEFSLIAQLYTEKDDRIIAYSFNNIEYIAANRLPASGHFFYLPWQEAYNKNPKFGIKIDACKEISEYRPKIMLITKWNVWDRYPWDSYAMCIQGLIDKGYTKYLDTQIYVRNDLVSLDTGLVFDRNSIKMIPSAQLNASTPLKLYFPNSEKYPSAGLKRLGVMFGTHMRKNTGEAELRLNGPDGATYSKRFALPDLADNQYLYFDLDSRIYTSGEIVSISGGGVSTWEIHSETTGQHTCIIYEYLNGRRGVTPGCPLK